MKFISTLALLASPLVVIATRVAYDTVYDNGGQSLSTVACSDGKNGLLTKNYNTFQDLPSYPNIGASSVIAGWNSPNCGSCWNITYEGQSVIVTVVDRAGDGFTLTKQALDKLTNNHAAEFGTVDGTGVQVANSLCGLK